MSITISPLSPTIGAEIGNVDLRETLSDTDRDQLYDALLTWKVLFFRDQDITTEQHLAFTARFGELEIHPFAPEKPGHPEVLVLHHDEDNPGRENIWHSDVTWRQQPSLGSVLRNIEAPEVGGDTLFADMYAAYDNLPGAIKDEIDGKVAVHDFAGFRILAQKRGATPEELADLDRTYPHPHHPVVRTHPDTGRRGLYVNRAFTRRILDVSPERSEELLEILYRQAAFPEYQCRFQWRANSIAFWDNRSAQHYAVSDYHPSVRRAERVTIVGDTPYFDPDQPISMDSTTPVQGALLRQVGR